MTLKKLSSLGLLAGLALALPALGCTGDDGTDDDGADDGGDDDGMTGDDDGTMTGDDDGTMTMGDGMDDDPDGSGDDGGATCPGGGGAGAVGDACTSNGDCESGVCLLFGDAPVPDDAVCAETPADCNTRITATVFDFEAGSRVGDIGVRVAAAVQVSTNPAGAPSIVEGTTDADGRLDVTTEMPIMAAIGIVGLVESDTYQLTATGVSSPSDGASYDVGNGNHELWAVSKEALATWSDALAMDAAIPAENLPLGENGGVVGLVRDSAGAAIDRALVVPDSGDSASIVRYLADDGSWSTDGTGSAGIFTIMNPALAETFHVEIDGATADGATGTAGSASGAIFTLIMTTSG